MASRSEFGMKTEPTEVLAAFPGTVEGKTIVITGVNPNGIGGALAEALAAYSPKMLILTGRTASKVEAVAKKITESTPGVQVRTVLFDISSFASIAKASEEINSYAESSIDMVFNNAGVMNIPERRLSADGFEMQLATNYLGLVLFTMNLLPKVKMSAAGRIVNVVSNGYALSPVRFSDYNFDGKGNELPDDEKPPKAACEAFGIPWGLDYLPHIAYGQSKTAAILFTRELADRLKGSNVIINSVHPGAIMTDLWREMPSDAISSIFHQIPEMTLAQGTSTMLVAALDPKLKEIPGAYLDHCQVTDVEPFAKDKAKAERLWSLTEKLLGKPLVV